MEWPASESGRIRQHEPQTKEDTSFSNLFLRNASLDSLGCTLVGVMITTPNGEMIMACEDFPCCGHEAGCCPDYDASGRQLNMRCVCGAVLPLNSRYSICDTCMASEDEDCDFDDRDFDDVDESMDGDFDSGMASAGFGTDEDYGGGTHLEDMGDWGFDE